MIFRIDLASSVSVYQQVIDQVRHAVATGTLAAGDRLPPIREVAAQTRVNRNTIAKAYAELERDGIIVSRPGQGSHIAETGTDLRRKQRRAIIEKLATDLYVEAYHLQIDRDEVRDILKQVEKTMKQEKKS